jgi:hypothetical protein
MASAGFLRAGARELKKPERGTRALPGRGFLQTRKEISIKSRPVTNGKRLDAAQQPLGGGCAAKVVQGLKLFLGRGSGRKKMEGQK